MFAFFLLFWVNVIISIEITLFLQDYYQELLPHTEKSQPGHGQELLPSPAGGPAHDHLGCDQEQ